ncbi:30S ribosomal protein S4 [Candidatus Margulisiibacteriota bacterium]
MARYRGPSCKLCRTEREKLFLKGDRCYTAKCAITRKRNKPGFHGAAPKKQSEYCIRMREKQKTRRAYGLVEKQFSNAFKKARQKKGVTGLILLQFMETRLDNIVYRLGFAESRKQARQMVRHGHFAVNSKKTNVPSMILRVGDIVSFTEISHKKFSEILKKSSERTIASWLKKSGDKSGELVRMPEREDIDMPVTENMIVELYSK